MTEEIIVYTAIVGGYDVLLPPRLREPGIRHVIFSERRPRPTWGWEWRPLPAEAAGMPSALANRWCKFFAHELLPEARISIYLDGNIRLVGPVRPLMDEFVASGAALGLFAHPDRRDVFEEASACRQLGKFADEDEARIDAQLRRYREGGLSPAHGLTENGVLVRAHEHPALPAAMALWWRELEQGVKRDQISLPWVRHTADLPVKMWPHSYRDPRSPFEVVGPHMQSRGRGRDLLRVLQAVKDDGPATRLLFAMLSLYRALRYRPRLS